MPDATWKAFERRIAKRHGGIRRPHDGSRAGDDIQHPLFAAQCKVGYRMPTYLQDWLDGIRATAARADKIGLVIWKPKGVRDDNAVVCLAFKDWEALHGSLEVGDDAGRTDGSVGSLPPDR